MTATATVTDIRPSTLTMEEGPERQLHALPAAYLDCRDLRHAWRRLGTTWGPYSPFGYRELHRELVCSRCDTQRTDIYEFPGYARVRSYYTYPDDYTIATGESGRNVDMADVRSEVFRRITPREAPND